MMWDLTLIFSRKLNILVTGMRSCFDFTTLQRLHVIGMLVVSLVSGDVLVLEPDSLQIRRSFNATQPIEEPGTEESITERLNKDSGDYDSFQTFIHCAAVSSNGKFLIMKDSQTSFNACNLVTGEHIQRFKLTTSQLGEIGPMALTRDGHQAATAQRPFITGGYSFVVTWNVSSGSRIHKFENYFNSPTELEFSPNGSFLICSDDGGEVTEFCLSGARFMTRNIHTGNYYPSEMSAVVYEPCSNAYLCGHLDGSVITVQSAGSNWSFDEEVFDEEVFDEEVFDEEASNRENTSATESHSVQEPTVPNSQIPFGKSTIAFGDHGDSVTSIAITSDGMRISIGGSRYLDNSQTHHRVKHECIEDDERSCWYTGFVAVYDATRIVPRWKNNAGVGGIFSVSFSLDDNLLASGGVDGVCRLWDSSKGTIVKTINLFETVTNVCFVFDIELQKKKRLAVAMSGHKRLGSESILAVLPEDVLSKLLLLV